MIPSPLNTSGVARAVLQSGLLTQPQIEALAQEITARPKSVIYAILELKQASALEIAQCLSKAYGQPLLDLDAVDTRQTIELGIDDRLMSSLHIIPLRKRGNSLFVGISDPTDLQTLQQLKFHTQFHIEPIIVEHDKLAKILQKLGQSNSKALDSEFAAAELSLDGSAADISADVEDAPVVRYIQKLLLDAIGQGASDLHFEPYEYFYRIRFRIDGVLQEASQPPVSTKEKLAARIKILSRLDISERRIPQDGRMRLVLEDHRCIDFRVSTLPTLFGEKIVVRILDPSSAQVGIDALGYEPEQRQTLMDAISKPYGMVLVTGPTGSGKTVSLYTCLNLLNKPELNVSTAEDPAEINLAGINQVNINDRVGLTFATALRAFLRQDPDIIMVGEIRDLETADISIKAAQTGHLVFSTLHTNDAAGTVMRLLNMGVAPFNIVSSLHLITAQRLVRKLCSCKETDELSKEALHGAGFAGADIEGEWTPFCAVGCERCNGTGYKGRTGIYEVMPISEEIQRLILASSSVMDIRAQARKEGVYGLREAGLKKVKAGITSLEEVLGATQI